MKTILTGIKPTGAPHIGNMLGAIKPAIEFSQTNFSDRFIYFIADYHALTGIKDAKLFQEYVYSVASTWLALGLTPSENVILFKQSDVPEVFELSWLLGCMTPKGDMNRAHAYKAIVDLNKANNNDQDQGVNIGLFTYPVLMAADILLYDSNIVPVGRDQVQHVEITRSIAQRFNEYFGETLIEPKESLVENGSYIPGLDGRKMSKSYDNTIPIFEPEKKLQKLINKIVTDSTPPEAPKDPNNSHIMDLYKLFGTHEQIKELENRYRIGIGWGHAKLALFEVMNAKLKEPRERYEYLMNNRKEVDEVLRIGAERARVIAQKTLKRVKNKMTGF
jgi:tryptophanyl-tRNA synthetase